MDFNWKKLQNGSDIRGVALTGIAGQEVNLDAIIVATLGAAFYQWLEKRNSGRIKVAVGMDSRLSGPELKTAFINSLADSGAEVLDCGMASTPAMFMTTITPPYKAHGGVMLTASHLPFNRNGLKFFTPEGGLEKKDITEILAIAETLTEPTQKDGGSVEQIDFISVYSNLLVDKIRKEVNSISNYEQPLSGFKMTVDAGNGAGGFYASKVLEVLGADVSSSQFLEPDGRFPNHVPNPEDAIAMKSICDAVKNNNTDLGIIFDTDVDRAAIVDENGNPINRNELVALSAAIVNEEHPGSTVVTDSITSDGLGWFITDVLKGQHHRFKRGYKNVINEAIRLNETGEESWLAIETSGHAALKENYFLDDGAYLVTKCVIKMAQLKKEGKSLTSLISQLPVPAESKEFRININAEDFKSYGEKVISELGHLAASKTGWELVPNNYEGVRVSINSNGTKGWFLLRLSLHDPVIPLNIESDNQGGVEVIAKELVSFFENFNELDLKSLINR
ncbi:phosphohexomutase domain-containing protein [Carboxylicivirga marina]|uniref:Phosphoglucomutase n=1 Tax=Carboxylicivirga marina TaxID=2800988 RepID=A0ABS1HJX5_9BACT|nr:phosphoglucomutase [Carboxylicivirga marina]MBK3517975.1 phosphoglucomutase [Carboxylicivirga marina]